MAAQREWTGHVVVCGDGGVALRTIEQLHTAGIAVVAVATAGGTAGGTAASSPPVDPVAERLLADWGVPVVVGRPREALAEAGLAGAAAVVCVPGADLVAMETSLLARRLRPDVRLVVRMSNPAVSRALAEVTGEGSVLDVAALAAPSVVEACLGARPHPFRLAGRDFVAAPLVAPRDATLRELYGPLAPLAVAEPLTETGSEHRAGGEPVICPGRDHRVRAGERVTLIGTPAQFAEHGGPPGRDVLGASEEVARHGSARHTARPGTPRARGGPGPRGPPRWRTAAGARGWSRCCVHWPPRRTGRCGPPC